MTELMGASRHEQLIKAAEDAISFMNDGSEPNAALMKSAEDHNLNAKEVALVSHAVNNSATISHLANSEGEAKADPFVLTNADEVTQQLFPDPDNEEKKPHNDIEPGKKPEDDEVVSPNSLDPQDQDKKMKVAGDSYHDDGFYRDVETDEHLKVAAEAFGYDPAKLAGGRQVIGIGLNGLTQSADFAATANQIKTALDRSCTVDVSRLSQNPHILLRNLKVAVEHARGKYTECRDAAFTSLGKIGEELRRTDAPDFARIEMLAKHAGCSEATLDVIWNSSGCERWGHSRNTMKVASNMVLTCSPREQALVDDCLSVETMWKAASDALASQEYTQDRLDHATKQAFEITKTAAAGDFVGQANAAVGPLSQTAQDLPGEMLGLGDTGLGGEALGKAMGTWSEDEKPSFSTKSQSPLDAAGSQRVRNTQGSVAFNGLFDDDYISQQPLPDIVRAYNEVVQDSQVLDPTVIRQAVKEHLARGGQTDLDTMLRTRKDLRDDELESPSGGQKA